MKHKRRKEGRKTDERQKQGKADRPKGDEDTEKEGRGRERLHERRGGSWNDRSGTKLEEE